MTGERVAAIIQDYEFHNLLILRFLEGISHEESVLPPPFEHNCLNWILGHIVANRSHVLETVGEDHSWQDEVRRLYHSGTSPVTPAGPALRLEDLASYLEESVSLLKSALDRFDETALDSQHENYRGEKSRYAHLTGFHWHESFHLGQLEVLRAFVESRRARASGK